MNAWTSTGLLALIALLILVHLFQDNARESPAGGAPAWSVACEGGLCVALDGAGNAFWGRVAQGSPPEGGFHWYTAGNLREAQPFGVALCRQRIERYEREHEALQAKLAEQANPNSAQRPGADAMENAQQRMLARIERLEARKKLEKLESEEGAPVSECRKLIGAGR